MIKNKNLIESILPVTPAMGYPVLGKLAVNHFDHGYEALAPLANLMGNLKHIASESVYEGGIQSINEGLANVTKSAVDLELDLFESTIGQDSGVLRSFGRLLLTQDPPKFLLNAFAVDNASELAQLINKDYQANDISASAMLNFFQWEHSQQETANHELTTNELPKLQADFGERLHAFNAKGYLPQSVLDKYVSNLKAGNITTHYSMYALLNDSEFTNTGGMHLAIENGKSEIVLRLGSSELSTEHAFTHETVHALEGRDEDIDGKPGPSGLYRVFGNGDGGTSINEAIVEHLADSLLHGNPTFTMPGDESRSNAKGVYMQERELLTLLCYGGEKTVSPFLFMKVLFSEGKEFQKVSTKLTKRLRQAYPNIDVIGVLKQMSYDNKTALDDFVSLLSNKVITKKDRKIAALNTK